MGTSEFNVVGNPVMGHDLIQGRNRNIPSHFMLKKLEKSASLLAWAQLDIDWGGGG